MNKEEFEKDLKQLINHYSIENGSNTPDFILCEYLMGCLETYNKTIESREKWYGRDPKPTETGIPPFPYK